MFLQLIFLLQLVLLQAVVTLGGSCLVEDVAHIGNNLDGFGPLNDPSWTVTTCSIECSKHPDCVFWNWREGTGCFLKSDTSARPTRGFVGGGFLGGDKDCRPDEPDASLLTMDSENNLGSSNFPSGPSHDADDLTSWLQLIAKKGVPGADARLAAQANAPGVAKGQPFLKNSGPLPHERVCIVGAGPAGLHMALSLKKRGYNRVTIFEKTNRVGGKSWDVHYRGLPQPMSTLYVLPDYFDTFVPLAKEYGHGDLRRVPKAQVWRTNSAVGPFNKLSDAEFIVGYLQQLTNFTEPVKNLAAFYRDRARYIEIHREMFGKYQGELMLKPGAAILQRIRGTFLDFLKRENLLTLIPFLTFLQTMPGYGYLDEISAFYGLMWITPRTMAWAKQGETSQGIYFLKDGFEEIWKSIVEKERLDVRFNSNLVKVDRTKSPIDVYLAKGTLSKVETCDFLVWAAPMSELLKVAEPSIATERYLFGSQTSIPYSSSLVNLKNVVRHGPAVLYHQNIVKKEEHGPTIQIDYQGFLAPNIRTKEVKAAYDEKTDEVMTATVIQMGKIEISTSLLNEKLENHYREGFNVTDVEFIESKTWSYFPRWSPEETGEGRHWQVFELQGRYRTWYAGASVSFESVKSVLEYNNLLLRQIIEPVTQLGPVLKTTYSPNPEMEFLAYASHPRTKEEAINRGYSEMSPNRPCNEKFLGYAYADPKEPSIAILFDAAGYIAGVQSIILKSAIDESRFTHAAYQKGHFFGQECLVTTAYFVDPAMICDARRSEVEWGQWRRQLTGDRLWIQIGETPTGFENIPVTQAGAAEKEGFYQHLCVPGMGEHFSQLNYQFKQSCGDLLPMAALYDEGVMVGFVWLHMAHLPGERWEHPDGLGRSLIKKPPLCLIKSVLDGEVSSLHHYFGPQPRNILCQDDINQVAPAVPELLTDPSLGDHKYFASNEVNLHYVESGNRKKPLIVFLHGFPDFWLTWRHQIKHFQDNYHVVALDMRGYGDSDKPAGVENYNIDLLVEDVKNLVDHLGSADFTLVGHDWGGMVAWYFAARYPSMVKNMVILNTPHPRAFHRLLEQDSEQKKKSEYLGLLQRPQPMPEFFFMKNGLAFFNSIEDERLREAYKFVFKKSTTWNRAINYYRDYFPNTAKAEEDYGAGLEDMDTPTLLIFGTENKYFSMNAAQSSSEYVNDFSLELLEGGSHVVHREEPERVNTLIANVI